ncbi:hypothetical protein DFJ74DRAFT_650581 [Hyaloraphidium curvatum]|nr:hypothetical protein DFJ74DRAFT_650581 [Hyaloraphidium curvatum]
MRPRKLTYAGITLALNTLDAVQELLALPGARWASFINLSGSDYPLLPPGELQDVLEAANWQAGRHLSFVAHWGKRTERWRRPALDPALWGHDRTLAKQEATWSWVQPDRPVPHGPTWVVLSRAVCEAALRSADMRRVLAALGGVEAAEESVWQMFFSWTDDGREIAGSVAGDCLRYDEPVEGESHVKWLRTRGQLGRALASGALFARKFEPASALLDAIDAMSEAERGKVRSRAVERIGRAVRSLLAARDGGNANAKQ